MLHRIFGVPGSGKREWMLSRLAQAFREGKRIFVLVPEQATADLEEKICALCGGTASMQIEVTNFSRLPNVVLREYGSLAGVCPTEAEKKLLLAECLHALGDQLSALNLRVDPRAVSDLYGELEGMRLAGLWSPALSRLAGLELSSPGLSEKLEQIALLTASYSDLLAQRFRDPSEEGERLAGILTEYPFFRDSVVFVDGFWDFTYPQEQILGRILVQAEDLYVSFAARKKETLLFAKTLSAAKALERAAKERGVKVQDTTLEKEEEDSGLGHLRTHFMRGGTPYGGSAEGIRIVSCKTCAEEADFVARECLRLVRSGARWSDIAILSRDGSGEELLALTLSEKGIPHFLEEKKPLARTPLAKTVLLACRFAAGFGEEDEVRSFIKDGVFAVSEKDRFCLEQYAATWGLTASAMLRDAPFTMNPSGYFKMSEADGCELERVNRAKEKIFAPVRTLSTALEAESVEEKIAAILAFLDAVGAERVHFTRMKACEEADDFETAAILSGAWNALLEALGAFASALGDGKSTKARFADQLALALSGNLPGTLPPGQDRVQVGRVDFARPADASYIFLMGVNAGVFPAPEQKGGLFPKRERSELSELGYRLPGGEESLSDEYFYFYLAASYAKKGLVLSYRSEDGEVDGAALSVLGKRVKTLIPALSEELFSSENALPQTPEEAFSHWITHLDEESEEQAALTRYFMASDTFRGRALAAAEGRAAGVNRDLLRTQKPYAGQDLNMVYSRLEKYTLCPFSYFSRYLLEAKTRQKATLGANVAGSFVHSVLEKVLISLSTAGKDLPALSSAELKEENKKAVDQALAELLADGSDAVLDFLVGRLEESCLLILENLQKEFSQSQFRPLLFEKSLGELDDTYRIPLSDGTELRLYGTVDRVDHYVGKNGEEFVRVVDYKTGGHSFSLTDVANGLSLQMLLYLFALWSCGFTHGGKQIRPQPAGVIYLNGLANPTACENRAEAQRALAEPFRALSREGLVVDDPELLSAQDPEGLGEFIPVAWGKSRPAGTANLVSLEQLGKLKKRVEKDFARLGERLKAGEIAAKPLTSRGRGIDPCAWCEYKPICKRSEADRRPYRSKVSREELFGEEEEV
ncbi:MAG: hypothetical protein E7580_07185 [Ruminococcaceae bacterium]|nr:hypothetical protein [Oscillospiraceae bacterium]